MSEIVKPLKWEEMDHWRHIGRPEAQFANFAMWVMQFPKNGGKWSFSNRPDLYDTLEAAKAAAQADYDARILSSLTADPRALVAAALERAAAKLEKWSIPMADSANASVGLPSVGQQSSRIIRALIDTDHATALEAVRAEARTEERMFLLAEAEEKAACIPAYAKIGPDVCWEPGSPWDRGYQAGCKAVADAIRARGESE